MRITIKLPSVSVVASTASRAGILAASANVAATFGRGLLPRSVTDQAVITGVCSAAIFQATTTAHAAAETIALLTTGSHGMRGRKPSARRTIAVDLALVGVGVVVDQIAPPRPEEHIAVSGARFISETLMLGGAAGALATAVDSGFAKLLPGETVAKRPLVLDVALGAAAASVTVYHRHRHAKEFGLVDPERRAIKRAGAKKFAKAGLFGFGAAAGMTALVAGEQLLATSIKRVLEDKVQRFDIASPLVGHASAFAVLGAAAGGAFVLAKRRIEKMGDVVEPAYPEPPTSPYVTAGPRSVIPFDTIGKEGRRFVLMALTGEEISAVMQEPAKDPVRIVGGYEAAANSDELVQLCLAEMDAVGAFERKLICIASPTGVGYVSYTFAESLEYLARGDCAIVVPQYALVPSAMALFDTHDGVALQKNLIRQVAARIAALPEDSRPVLVQFGESLGAQVALDVATPFGVAEFDSLGLRAGLYLGVPFRSKAWNEWRTNPKKFDPHNQVTCVAEPGEVDESRKGRNAHLGEQPQHLMVVHDDDPVNKFSYALVIRPPWWMGPPSHRPPMVPRETIWRPVTTFMLTLIDLFNGMDFKPGEFMRRGHDYRIDSCDAANIAYGLPATEAQTEAIGAALRQREQEWAARRLVARKFAGARESISRTLKSWGVQSAPMLDSGPNDSGSFVADIDPHSDAIPRRLGSSGVL